MAKPKQRQAPENWEDREGNLRPTKERRKKGNWRLVDGEDAGDKYALDEESFEFAQMYREQVFTPEQWDGATRYVELARKMRGSPSQRSCLDFSPIGHDDDDGNPEMEREWKEIGKELGFYARHLLDEAMYREGKVEHVVNLRAACDICVDYWGIKS